uniref:type II toxin-antitoxin system VapC family toxin n=1 Tax=Mesorhizobium sp. WSM4875 TaxID=3038539 RepID=UPI002415BBE1|nr:type II toxin-antitoxin system VapC family toxin [Mesorhizobium sp. WSM4875]WIE94753.1 type II toxin-antitoxin system VapC family toxin [Mesorhizobium sp. WSM4875]
MFVDACAIISVFAQEKTAFAHEQALEAAAAPWTSALAAWEAIIILSRPDQLNCRYEDAQEAVIEWLDARNIELREIASPRDVLTNAVAVAQKHGIGKRSLSNFDCFHYAYAKVADVPLLSLDQKLRETDIMTLP